MNINSSVLQMYSNAIGFPDKMDYASQLKYDLGHDGLGVIFNSGLGDGLYKVYGKMKNCRKLGKRLAEVKIVFLDKSNIRYC